MPAISTNSQKPWADSEVEFLISTHEELTTREQAHQLGRTFESVYQKKKRLRSKGVLKKQKLNPWTAEEVQFMLDNSSMKSSQVAERLNRGLPAVYTQRFKLIQKGLLEPRESMRVWSRDEEARLEARVKEMGGKGTIKDLCREFGKTESSVNNKLQELRLKSDNPNSLYVGRRWTAEEDARIADLYAEGATAKGIARDLDRPFKSVASRIADLQKEGAVGRKKVRWTAEEDQVILDNLDLAPRKVAQLLGGHRDSLSVSRRKRKLLKDLHV